MYHSKCDRNYKSSQWVIKFLLLTSAVCTSAKTDAYELNLVARQFDVIDGQELDLFLGVALDDQGNVAYTAVAIDEVTKQQTGSALLINNQRVVATADMIGSGLLGFIGEPDLAGDGTLAYSADVFAQGAGLSNTGAVVGDPSSPLTQQLLAGRNAVVSGVQLEGAINPTVNSLGALAYTGIYHDAVLGIDASAIIHGGRIIAVTADTVGNFVVDVVDHASINDQGDLVFEASLINLSTSESSTAIFMNGQLTAYNDAITDGILLTEVFAPTVNGLGDLAYIGRFVDQASGLENTAVILNGQAVLRSGHTARNGLIIDLIEDVALNASGQLAIQATFIDPGSNVFFEQGIFLTQIIPEPNSAVLLGVSALLIGMLPRQFCSSIGDTVRK